MSNKQTLLTFGIIVALLLGLMYLFAGKGKTYNWSEHYRADSQDPYGTSIVFNLLKDYFPKDTFTVIEDDLPAYLLSDRHKGNYIYIGSWLWLDSIRTDALLRFVEKGNNAFIASSEISPKLLDSVSQNECLNLLFLRDSVYYGEPDNYVEDSLVILNFSHPNLAIDPGYALPFRIRNEQKPYSWSYLYPELFCGRQSTFASLGTLNDSLINFTKAAYGKGYFYLHTTPLAFTNIQLTEPAGLEYAEKVFTHLPAGNIFWDKTSLRFEFPSDRRRNPFSESPLKYILSQPALAWAWYLLLAMAVLFLIFRAKRKQRVIPVLEKNENTSMEFIQTIGRLYFLQNNHRQLALQKMKLFLGFIREHYNMSTRELDDTFRNQLAIKSEIPQEVIDKIFTMHQNIEKSGFSSDQTLIDFHRAMEYFYLNCK